MTKSGKNRLILSGVGVLLILLGIRGVALQVAGKSTHATITDVRRAVTQQSGKMDHNYHIAYRFSVDGKDYSGSLTRKKVYNTSTLPNVGGTVAIRYLPAAPAVNSGPNEGIVGGLVFGALGVGLLIAGLRPRKPANPAAPLGDQHADSPG